MNSYIGILLDKLLDDEIRSGKTDYIKEGREKYEVLEYHFENEYPSELLNAQHPSEEPWMRDYRRNRWQSPTLIMTGRVYQFLQKIQQADDFKIKFENDFAKTGIAEVVNGKNNTLGYYCEKEIPLYKDLESWLFNSFLKAYLSDPNGIVLILPDTEQFIKNPDKTEQLDWTRPYPQIYCIEDVILEGEDWVIVEVEDWKDANKKKWKQFMVVTKEGLLLFRQIGPFKEPSPFQVYEIPYSFEYLPVIKNGNVVNNEEDGHLVYDSVLTPCLPAWNEVLYRTDDLNILFAVHALPQKWALKLSPCKTCNGTGYRSSASKERTDCRDCNGSGRASSTPFSLLEINVDRSTAINPSPSVPPIPPAGYIERPIDSVKLFQDDILQKEYQGFKAIGLEILGQVPSAQSGISKEYDRKELNTFCYSVCVHLASVYRIAVYHILYQRYNALFASSLMSDEKVKAALPDITIPTDFDVLTSSVLGNMLATAKQGHFNPIIINGIEMDYVEKLYGENSPKKTYLKILTLLDPLPFKNTDEKTMLLQASGCSKVDYILSANLPAFVVQLMDANPDWESKDLTVQRADVIKLAEAKLAEINKGLVPIMPQGV
jgi:hypothetical protein